MIPREPDELCEWVEAELAAVLPPGWSFERLLAPEGADFDAPLAIWRVALVDADEPDQSHDLEISADGSLFLLSFGNSDAGPFQPRQLARQARVVRRADLELMGLRLSAVLLDLLGRLPPDCWSG